MDENKAFYTNRQFARAKKARELYHALGTPSTQDFKAMLQMNLITNNPITMEDMKDWILLDNESTVTIFCNPNMVSDI